MFKSVALKKGIVYYSDLIPELEHYFTTRETNVDDNYEFWVDYLSVSGKNLLHPSQTHSSNVGFVKQDVYEYPDTDALILTNNKQAVYLRFADCTPIIVYDKKANIAAVVHAGWRGTVAGILPKAIESLSSYSKSPLHNIYVVIGPAIDKCCYSVGQEVVSGIKNSVKNPDDLIFERDGKVFADLKSTNFRQATEFGIPAENLDVCPFCTCCDNNLFFSYRKENGTHKRHNAVIKLK